MPFNPPPTTPVVPADEDKRGLQLPYKELGTRDGSSPGEDFTREDCTARRSLLIDWDTRDQAIYQLLGYPQRVADGPGWKITRYLPDFHPKYPWMVVSKVRVAKGLTAQGKEYDPADTNRHVQHFKKAVLDVEYDFPRYDIKKDSEVTAEYERFVEVQARPSGDYLTPPGNGGLWWSEGPEFKSAFPANIGVIVPMMEYKWTWSQVPYLSLPIDTIQSTLGKVNKTEFFGKPAGTLLLVSADLKRVNTPYGERSWTVEYGVKYNKNTHNKYLSKIGGIIGWYQVIAAAVKEAVEYFSPGSVPDGKLTYDEVEFSDLFKSA